MKRHFLFLFVAACGPPLFYKHELPLDKAELRLALGEVVEALQVEMGERIDNPGGVRVVVSIGNPGPGYDGMTDCRNGSCTVVVDPPRVLLPYVIMHELGHTLGLGHSPDTGNIMYKNTPAIALDVAAHQIEESYWKLSTDRRNPAIRPEVAP